MTVKAKAAPPAAAVAADNGAIASSSSSEKSSRLPARLFEAVIWTLGMAIYFLWYNAVGQLTKMRGVDYTPYFITRFDLNITPFCWTIIPYVITYILPIYYLLLVWRYQSLELGFIRRAWTAHFVMITLGYFIFYFVPVQITSISDQFLAGDNSSLFNHWSVQFVHRGMTKFCAWPSMHVANVWYYTHVFRAQRLPGKIWVDLLAWSQFLATIGTRAHFLSDLPSGVFLAEFAARVVFKPLERRGAMTTPRALPSNVLPFIVAVPIALAAGLHYLETVTGWGGLAEMLK